MRLGPGRVVADLDRQDECPPGRVTRLISATVRSRSSTWSSEFMLVTTSNSPSANGIASEPAATYSIACASVPSSR